MKTRIALLFGGLWLMAGMLHGGEAAKDQKALQGTWKATKGEASFVLVLKGQKFKVTFEDDEKKMTFTGTFKVDPSKDPKQIDMTIKKGEKYVGEVSRGIYEVKGDTLKWCVTEPGREERPSDFRADQEGQLFLILKRERK